MLGLVFQRVTGELLLQTHADDRMQVRGDLRGVREAQKHGSLIEAQQSRFPE